MGELALGYRILQGPDHMILTDEVRKGLTPVFAVESEMSHVNAKEGAGKTTSHREPAYRC